MKSLTLNRPEYSESLIKSLVYYLDDGFYSSSVINTSGNLKKIDVPDPSYIDGQVWGSNKKNWDWLSPVVVNSVPLSSGNTVNFRDGLIYMDSAKNSVSANYSYRPISVIDALDNDFFRGTGGSLDVYEGVYRPDSVQLPLIAIEYAGVRKSEGYELGSYTRNNTDEYLLNIFSSTKPECNRLADILFDQTEATFRVFNYKQALNSNSLPLDSNGFLQNISGTYTNLCNSFPVSGLLNSEATVLSTDIEKVTKLKNGLYHCTVRFEIDTIRKMSV